MICTQCGKEYTPSICDACGTPGDNGLCPQCRPAGQTACPNCGKEAASPLPMGEHTSPTPEVGAATPPNPAPSAEPIASFAPAAPVHQAPPQGPAVAPEPSLPGGTSAPQTGPAFSQGAPQPPPPAYGGQAPQGGPTPYSNGPAIPPPNAMPGGFGMYAGRPIPTSKVPLGGWLMVFFVFNCIALGYHLISLLFTIATGTSNLLSIGVTLIFTLLPALMVFIYILLRDIKFKYWFYAQAILSFLGCILLLLGCLILASDPSFLNTILTTSNISSTMGSIDMYSFASSILSITLIFLIIFAVVSIGLNIAWWVYFNKSRRVAYTFNPINNPPR